MGLLEISVAAGEADPVLTLSGEADLTTVAELTEALTAQLAAGARHLTVDLSRSSPAMARRPGNHVNVIPDHVNGITSPWLPRPARGDQDGLAGLLCLEHM